jgi:hypothetical protein
MVPQQEKGRDQQIGGGQQNEVGMQRQEDTYNPYGVQDRKDEYRRRRRSGMRIAVKNAAGRKKAG